ncbi:flagellar FlbD family protein [Georgenia subflava]|uniref:Flagellar protein FlbD n=1 Tax=Georgenia subflava TaxID=1622177 RepID=A0A6N7ELJ4_9MICO|nr:flagellar FlbD family protein [Georgenia subflava]MPV38999.1 flagellar protein FlbD [Georgenia subflava]
MIIVRRLNGQPFAINPDLIERIEATPDTILVLLDGTKYIVNEPMDEVVRLIEEHRAAVVARSLRRPATSETAPPRGTGDVVPLPTRHRGE